MNLHVLHAVLNVPLRCGGCGPLPPTPAEVTGKRGGRHAEEAAFLWLLRDRAVGQPQHTLRSLAALDDRVDAQRGMDIVIVTTAKTDAEAKSLLKGFDMPFQN